MSTESKAGFILEFEVYRIGGAMFEHSQALFYHISSLHVYEIKCL